MKKNKNPRFLLFRQTATASTDIFRPNEFITDNNRAYMNPAVI